MYRFSEYISFRLIKNFSKISVLDISVWIINSRTLSVGTDKKSVKLIKKTTYEHRHRHWHFTLPCNGTEEKKNRTTKPETVSLNGHR